jgi:hypothetical protein
MDNWERQHARPQIDQLGPRTMTQTPGAVLNDGNIGGGGAPVDVMMIARPASVTGRPRQDSGAAVGENQDFSRVDPRDLLRPELCGTRQTDGYSSPEPDHQPSCAVIQLTLSGAAWLHCRIAEASTFLRVHEANPLANPPNRSRDEGRTAGPRNTVPHGHAASTSNSGQRIRCMTAPSPKRSKARIRSQPAKTSQTSGAMQNTSRPFGIAPLVCPSIQSSRLGLNATYKPCMISAKEH